MRARLRQKHPAALLPPLILSAVQFGDQRIASFGLRALDRISDVNLEKLAGHLGCMEGLCGIWAKQECNFFHVGRHRASLVSRKICGVQRRIANATQ